ncbi:MAG: extracellular solute-binding protein [Candidatus Melainabacteria bacterium]|nr:extracellular solute-binding protein [Candidatus Melainabacteria bacterium]
MYWQFWTGFEEEAIEKVVEKFNKEHKNIKVKMLTISEPWKKTLLSIIGGTPPDVLNTTSEWLPELAQRGALIPLEKYCEKHKIKKEMFIPVYFEMLEFNGHVWGLPLTPSSTAIFWNKNLFKKAGLNPEKPPQKASEILNYIDKLTIKDKKGNITQAAFLPSWPSWANSFYPYFFNGSWGYGNNLTANHKLNIKGWEWAKEASKKLGAKNIQTFQEEFGNIQGPNNPFYSEKIAIEINGVWEANFISKFAPDIEWGAAPAKTIDDKLTTSVICVPIVIPKGAKNPDEAFYFISWLMKPENIEELAIGQKIFSPLIVSDREDFIKRHPNPFIKVFIDSARSKNAKYFPSTTAFQLYKRELKNAFNEVISLKKDKPILTPVRFCRINRTKPFFISCFTLSVTVYLNSYLLFNMEAYNHLVMVLYLLGYKY